MSEQLCRACCVEARHAPCPSLLQFAQLLDRCPQLLPPARRLQLGALRCQSHPARARPHPPPSLPAPARRLRGPRPGRRAPSPRLPARPRPSRAPRRPRRSSPSRRLPQNPRRPRRRPRSCCRRPARRPTSPAAWATRCATAPGRGSWACLQTRGLAVPTTSGELEGGRGPDLQGTMAGLASPKNAAGGGGGRRGVAPPGSVLGHAHWSPCGGVDSRCCCRRLHSLPCGSTLCRAGVWDPTSTTTRPASRACCSTTTASRATGHVSTGLRWCVTVPAAVPRMWWCCPAAVSRLQLGFRFAFKI